MDDRLKEYMKELDYIKELEFELAMTQKDLEFYKELVKIYRELLEIDRTTIESYQKLIKLYKENQ